MTRKLLLGPLTLGVVPLAVPCFGQQFTSMEPQTFHDEFAIDMLAMDVDHDGDDDIVISSLYGSIDWFETTTDGRVALAESINTSPPGQLSPISDLTPIDMDEDGLIDLVVSHAGIGVEWYRNEGGRFSAPTVLVSSPDPLRIVGMIDVDFDGRQDLVVAGLSGAGLHWCPSNGSGSFGAPAPLWSQLETVTDAVPADIDGDGDMDVVVLADLPPRALAAVNVGVAGTMQPIQLHDFGSPSLNPRVIYAEELTGDGLADVVVVFSFTSFVLESLGGGQYGTNPAPSQLSGNSLAFLDADRNGSLDVMEEYSGDVWLNDGTGGLTRQTAAPPILGNGFRARAVGDVNGDGWLDIAYEQLDRIGWISNSATGSAPLFSPDLVFNETFGAAADVTSFDADGDGDPEIVAARNYDNRLWLYDNEAGDAQFLQRSPTGQGGFISPELRVGDFDGNGVSDLAVTGFRELRITLGTGNLGFQPTSRIDFGLDENRVFCGEPHDMNGDGFQDLVTLTNDGSVFGPSILSLWPGDGAGGFGPRQPIVAPIQGYVTDVRVADVDGDGHVDVIARSRDDAGVLAWLGDSTGSFASAVNLTPGLAAYPSAYDLFDFDGDGDLDTFAHINPATSPSTPLQVATYPFASGAGQPATQSTPSSVEGDIEIVDLDGDGVGDLVYQQRSAGGGSGREMIWKKGDSQGGFGPLQIISAPYPDRAAWTLVDYDGDADVDILVAQAGDGGIGLLRNQQLSDVGVNYCDAVPNSTGVTGRLTALGSTSISAGAMRLRADRLPRTQFTLFASGRARDSILLTSFSVGRLCLGGALGRFLGPGQVQTSGQSGQAFLELSLTALPTSSGLVPAVAGATWTFQAWHRDGLPTGVTSNFTDAVELVFTP